MDNTHTLEILGRTYTLTNYYKFIDGSLHRNVVAGLIKENQKPYRVAGNYSLYVNSFPNSALPYSIYLIADKRTGNVYSLEVIHGMSNEKEYIKNLVQYLKEVSA